jgi:hypothetical protein
MALYIRSNFVYHKYEEKFTCGRLYRVIPRYDCIDDHSGEIYAADVVCDNCNIVHVYLPSSQFLNGRAWTLCDENGLEVENSEWTEEKLRRVSEGVS